MQSQASFLMTEPTPSNNKVQKDLKHKQMLLKALGNVINNQDFLTKKKINGNRFQIKVEKGNVSYKTLEKNTFLEEIKKLGVDSHIKSTDLVSESKGDELQGDTYYYPPTKSTQKITCSGSQYDKIKSLFNNDNTDPRVTSQREASHRLDTIINEHNGNDSSRSRETTNTSRTNITLPQTQSGLNVSNQKNDLSKSKRENISKIVQPDISLLLRKNKDKIKNSFYKMHIQQQAEIIHKKKVDKPRTKLNAFHNCTSLSMSSFGDTAINNGFTEKIHISTNKKDDRKNFVSNVNDIAPIKKVNFIDISKDSIEPMVIPNKIKKQSLNKIFKSQPNLFEKVRKVNIDINQTTKLRTDLDLGNGINTSLYQKTPRINASKFTQKKTEQMISTEQSENVSKPLHPSKSFTNIRSSKFNVGTSEIILPKKILLNSRKNLSKKFASRKVLIPNLDDSADSIDVKNMDRKVGRGYKQLNIRKKVLTDEEKTKSIVKDVRLKSRLLDRDLFLKLINFFENHELANELAEKPEIQEEKLSMFKTIVKRFIRNCKISRENRLKEQNDIYGEEKPKKAPERILTQQQMNEFIRNIKFDETSKIKEKLNENNNYARSWDYSGMTALHWACIKRNTSLIQLQISCKVNVNAKDLVDRTPIYFAATNQDLEIIRILLIAGSNPWSNEAYRFDEIVTDSHITELLKRARKLWLIKDISNENMGDLLFDRQKYIYLGDMQDFYKAHSEILKLSGKRIDKHFQNT